MPLQATSGAASYDAFGGGVAAVPQYIEDVFGTFLYTGNGSTQTITNGIDLAGKGGLVWLKSRSLSAVHTLVDTARGSGKTLFSDLTNAQATNNAVSAFNSNGFTMGDYNNTSPDTYASWTFRKAPKFFDVVTYTGDGTNGRTVAHSLGSVPGCMIVKRTDAANGWAVYHRAMNASPQDYMMRLNATDAAFTTSPSRWNNTLPTSTEFTLSGNDEVNGSGATYVAYLFAHNAGGFGLTGTDNVISCGSFTTNGSGVASVDLGYEPQWLLVKANASGNDWYMYDNMRGLSYSNYVYLSPNLSAAEGNISADYLVPTATGFQTKSFASSTTYIYIAIRRGPMKVPTSGTSVFQPIIDTGDTIETSTATFPLDMQFNTLYSQSNATYNNQINDRLRGIGFAPSFTTTPHLTTASTAAETTSSSYLAFKGNGMDVTKDTGWGATAGLFYNFRRAPSFFDEVCYTGTGTSTQLVYHNLQAEPNLIIQKRRNSTSDWYVSLTDGAGSVTQTLLLNTTGATGQPQAVLYTSPTYFGAFDSSYGNISGATFVAYLFATCAGVSKCTAFTGTGTLQTIDCGFTSGARFVLVKRTDSTGDWYVWDSSRGLSSSTDPYLLLNSTAAEVTSTNWVDTTSTGFQVTAASGNNVNINGASYIALAIA